MVIKIVIHIMPRMSSSHDLVWLACLTDLPCMVCWLPYTREKEGTSHVAQLTSVCIHVSYVDRL